MRKLLSIWVIAGCAGGFGPVDIPAGSAHERLSSWNLVRDDDGELRYNERVQPYTLNTPLFSDYASKDRALYIPEGETASWRDSGVFDFPEGTTLLKTFSFPADLREPDRDLRRIETRVLVRVDSEWRAWPYLWDEDEGDAFLQVEGSIEAISLTGLTGEDLAFSYLVPQRNQCADCHELDHPEEGKGVVPIGPTGRNLHRPSSGSEGTNQLDILIQAGMLSGAPDLSQVAPATDWATVADADLQSLPYPQIDAAARDYLDVNCASCHNPRGVNGITSQLFLNWDNADRFHLGVCKKPGSAAKGTGGRSYDIVPGNADQSILHYRINTDDLGSMMPEFGRSVVHDRGVAVVEAWINGMQDPPCE